MPTTTLLLGPPGDPAREPFFARVVEACQRPETAGALRYIVPTARRRVRVEADLLRACGENDAVCLPRVQTLDALAREIYLATMSSRLISSRAAAMVIEHVLSEAPGDFLVLLAGRTPPFSGLVEALAGMIRELKRHARRPPDLAGVARESPKARECTEVWRRYDAFLAVHGWADLQDVMLSAATAIQDTARRDSILPGTTDIIVEGFVEFSPAEEPLVRALADSVDTTFVIDRDPVIADRFQPLPGWLPKAARRANEAPFLDVARIALAAQEKPTPGPAPSVVLIAAPSREDEVEQIASEAKRVLRGGNAQRDVIIVVPDLEAYALIIEEAFAEHGVPCSVGRSTPLIESPVALTVLQLVETPARRFDRKDLTALLRSPFLDLGPDASAQTAPVVEELARTMRIFGGKDDWIGGLHDRIEHLVRSAGRPLPDLDDEEVASAICDDELGRLRLIDALLPRILDLLDGLTEPRSPGGFVAVLRRLMTAFRVREQCTAADAAGKAVPSHTRCCEELLRVLDEIESLDPVLAWPRPMALDAFAELVRAAIASARVAPPAAPPGIEILGLHDAASRSAKVVFCAGLVEGAVPAAPRRDPLLPSSIRSALGLPDTARLRKEAWIDVYRVLAGASERLVLSRPTADGEAPLLEAPMLTRVRTTLGLTPQTPQERPDTHRSLL
ncbi:MAG TPA: hypothetical protein VFH61_04550, partial [Thermoleophilia bacterium]|nr:hypothetical protein [Thermoleophilia bacterium]